MSSNVFITSVCVSQGETPPGFGFPPGAVESGRQPTRHPGRTHHRPLNLSQHLSESQTQRVLLRGPCPATPSPLAPPVRREDEGRPVLTCIGGVVYLHRHLLCSWVWEAPHTHREPSAAVSQPLQQINIMQIIIYCCIQFSLAFTCITVLLPIKLNSIVLKILHINMLADALNQWFSNGGT